MLSSLSPAAYGTIGTMAEKGFGYAEARLREAQALANSGNLTWKVAAVVAGAGIIFVSVTSISTHLLSPFSLVMDLYMTAFGVLTVVLENKEHLLPQKYLDMIRIEALFLYRPYGRSAFYFFVGVLMVSQNDYLSLAFCVGVYTSVVGAIIFVASRSAMDQARALKAAAFDEATIKRKFLAADRDKNGTLDTAELAVLCADLGCNLSRNELEAALVVLDKDGNGAISYDEFLEWYQGQEADGCM